MRGDKTYMDIKVENLYIREIDKTINLIFERRLSMLIGNNGSGKTILLDYISNLKKLPQGSKITGNKNLIYLNQNMYYNGRLTVNEYLKFIYNISNILEYKEYFFEFIKTHSENTLEEIRKMLNKKMGDLSGGERRYLYNLIVLSIDREWYILDEPLAGMDKDNKKTILEIIYWHISNNKGIIMTTHEEIGFHNNIEEDKVQVIKCSLIIFLNYNR